MNIERQDNFIRGLGVEAYRVGGSVRDEILGRKPKDADYIIRGIGLPLLKGLLKQHTRNTARGTVIKPLTDRQGQQFGWRCNGIEIALPRRESDAGSGRAQTITVDPDLPLSEDAKRRDFTFNALYRQVGGEILMPPVGKSPYDPYVLDPTGNGLYDLKHRIIRTTHPDSFRDDPLRTLRALRFVAQGFDLSSETQMQMVHWAPEVSGLSAKGYTSGTVYTEFSKILMGQRPEMALRFARDSLVLANIMPELKDMLGFEQGSRYHDLTTDEHTFVTLHTAAHVEAPLRVRWALLFHDAGKPEAVWCDKNGNYHYYAAPRNLLDPDGHLDDEAWALVKTEDHEVVGECLWREAAKRMGVDRRMTNDVATLIRNHMVAPNHHAPGVWVRRKRVELGDDLLRDLLMMRACDLSGKGSGKVSLDHVQHIVMLERIREEAAASGVPTSRKELHINGTTLRELIGVEGRSIGRVLNAVLDEVVIDPSSLKLTYDWQLDAARRLA